MYKWSSAENLSSSAISTLSSELNSCLRPPTGCPYYVYSTKNRVLGDEKCGCRAGRHRYRFQRDSRWIHNYSTIVF